MNFMRTLKTLFHTITLIFSILLASNIEAKSIENIVLPKSKLKLDLEYSSDITLSYKDRLVFLVDTAIVEYTKLFGGLPRTLNGSPYTTLSINVSNGFGGEADPGFIDLRISNTKLFGFYNWEMILLHEVLHLWSAETFLYVDNEEQWFNEGVTEYLSFQLAAKLGIIRKEDILNTFSRPISTYLSAKGIGKHSLRSAGSTDKLKKEHYFLIYHGGFVAGMVLDHQIRTKSQGKFTLNNLMSELYKSHSRDKPYSSASIREIIQESMNVNVNGFFERHIYGNQIIPVGNYFDIGGLMLSKQFGSATSERSQKILSDMLTFE